jgi:methylated-DNA-[protein]-cysteine S-methyltransferase
MILQLGRLASPLGELLVVTDSHGRVRALDFANYHTRLLRLLREHYGEFELTESSVPEAVESALMRYFAGDLKALDNLPTATNGSALEQRVWHALRQIPAGQTSSYGEVARSLGLLDPRAAVDVGLANKSNPIAIIVPCHRVVGKNGELKGYAGGPNRKRWLLEHEGAIASVSPTEPPAEACPYGHIHSNE